MNAAGSGAIEAFRFLIYAASRASADKGGLNAGNYYGQDIDSLVPGAVNGALGNATSSNRCRWQR